MASLTLAGTKATKYKVPQHGRHSPNEPKTRSRHEGVNRVHGSQATDVCLHHQYKSLKKAHLTAALGCHVWPALYIQLAAWLALLESV